MAISQGLRGPDCLDHELQHLVWLAIAGLRRRLLDAGEYLERELPVVGVETRKLAAILAADAASLLAPTRIGPAGLRHRRSQPSFAVTACRPLSARICEFPIKAAITVVCR
jgi:hypothetical protein